MVDLLLCALRKNCLKLTINDEDEYDIVATFLESGKRCSIILQISKVNDNMLAIEFIKTEGSKTYFNEKVKFIKSFLNELQEPVTEPKRKAPKN